MKYLLSLTAALGLVGMASACNYPIIAQPIVAQPIVQAVYAQPIMQAVYAQPVVYAQPIVSQVYAQPFVSQAVYAQPVAAVNVNVRARAVRQNTVIRQRSVTRIRGGGW